MTREAPAISRAHAPPPIVFRGRTWSSDEIAGIARAWWSALDPPAHASSDLTAMVMANHPAAVALFFALSARWSAPTSRRRGA